jgi:hypothetical protein
VRPEIVEGGTEPEWQALDRLAVEAVVRLDEAIAEAEGSDPEIALVAWQRAEVLGLRAGLAIQRAQLADRPVPDLPAPALDDVLAIVWQEIQNRGYDVPSSAIGPSWTDAGDGVTRHTVRFGPQAADQLIERLKDAL